MAGRCACSIGSDRGARRTKAPSGTNLSMRVRSGGSTRMIHTRGRAGTIGLALLIGTAWGCGGGSGGGGAPATPAATIIVDGSSTVYRISRAAQGGFSQVDPGVTVVVDYHGTGGGFSRYLQ